jgi:pimeloyl-ACP methyl ester carboxylesterase
MAEASTYRVPVSRGQTIALDWTAPAGDAPVAVFIHGFGSNRRGEKSLYFAERFAQAGWGYLAFDFRGHGESDGRLRELTLTGLLEDLGSALAWLEARLPGHHVQKLLVASSMGASVAAWHLLAHPGAARGLAMIGPSLRFPAGMAASLAPEELAAWRAEGVRRVRNKWLDVELGYGLVEDSAQYAAARLMRAHDTPALILHGMADEAVPWKQSLEFMETCACPGLRLVLIKDGDHRLTRHKPFLYETIRAWWEELPS